VLGFPSEGRYLLLVVVLEEMVPLLFASYVVSEPYVFSEMSVSVYLLSFP